MRVARGLDETCGRERNSSRSMVPELSFSGGQTSVLDLEAMSNVKAAGLSVDNVKKAGTHFVKFHETLPQPVKLLTIDCCSISKVGDS